MAKLRGRLGAVFGAGAAAALAASSSAAASPAVTVWSSFMHAGPSYGAQVVDELEHDTQLDLEGCQGDWCRVRTGRAEGYIEKDALTLTRLPTRAGAGDRLTGCFIAGQYGFSGEDKTRFCQLKGPKPPPTLGPENQVVGGRGLSRPHLRGTP